MTKIIIALFALAFSFSTAQGQLFINEVLAGNSNDLADDFNENDDWIEIYNAGSSLVNLSGYFLTDSNTNIRKDTISPNESLFVLPNNHVLIWCDKDQEQGNDHITFKLSTEGETVTLSNPDGDLVDMISYPVQENDISYGRVSDGDSEWQYFNNTTPQDPNAEEIQPDEVLFINEILTNNTANISDENGEFDAWVEIYNPNAQQVNLAGYTFSNPATSETYTLPNTNPSATTVEAGSFRIFWLDGETAQGAIHLGFELTDSNGSLVLTGPQGSTTDTYAYTISAANVSYGRSSDGGPNSVDFNIPTPRVTNQLVIVQPEEVYINEIMSQNIADVSDEFGEKEDWFEIYNPGTSPVNLAGYYLTDNPNNPDKFQIPLDDPANTTIAAGGFLLFFADEDGSQGTRHASFRFNNAGESILLFSPDAFTLADQFTFGAIAPDWSMGRLTDGASDWVYISGTTPGESNNGASQDISVLAAFAGKIYPNPSQGIMQLTVPAQIQVLDLAGKMVFNSRGKISRTNLSHLPSGIYIVRLDSGQVLRWVKG